MQSGSSMPLQRLRRMLVERLLASVLILATVLFLPAGTLRYWEAWLFMIVLLLPVAGFGTYLLKRNPALLERRLKMREEQPEQKRIVAPAILVLFAVFLLPGLDRRFGWSSVPTWLVVAADAVMLLGYLLFVLTLRANEYASRTIRVEKRQRVVTTGPYALIRHPLYAAAIVIYGASPLALGSYWALLPAALFPTLLVVRIFNEETVLLRELDGYADYSRAVRYRLIPGIW